MAKSKKDFSQQVSRVLDSALAPDPEPEVAVTEATAPVRRFGASSVKVLSTLSDDEARRLATLEATIDRGMTTFLEVGRALIEIQDNKLYRATHLTIEQYMLDRFNLNRNRGYQLIQAAKVVNQIAEEIKPAANNTEEGSEEASTEGYAAVPTGKVRRPKPAPSSNKLPEDVDYTEEPHDDADLAEASTDSDSSVTRGKPSFVWTAPEEEETEEQGQGERDDSNIPLPANESHAAALAQLPEDKRTDIWKKTVAESQKDGKPITASRIKKTAEQVGVPLNKKAPKDRKASKNAFGKNPEADDDFSESAREHTRQAMNATDWLSPQTQSLRDTDLSEETSVNVADRDTDIGKGDYEGVDVVPAGSGQALSEALGSKVFDALPGEIMVSVRGSFLIREGISDAWQTRRGDDRLIDEQYVDTMGIREFWDLIGGKRG